jgi:hypothetical protein
MKFLEDVRFTLFGIAVAYILLNGFVLLAYRYLGRWRMRALPEADKRSSLAVGTTTARNVRRITGKDDMSFEDYVIPFHVFPTELKFYCSGVNASETVSVPLSSFDNWRFRATKFVPKLSIPNYVPPREIWFSRGGKTFKLTLHRWEVGLSNPLPMDLVRGEEEFLERIGAAR